MASRSLCLPPARTHFWTLHARRGVNGGSSSPRKYGTNCIIPELVNMGADGWCGIKLAAATGVWARAVKNSVQARRSWSAFMVRPSVWASEDGPGPGIDAGAQVLLGLPHGDPALGDGSADVLTEGAESVSEVARHALGRVALDRVADEPHQPERDAEAEAGTDHQPEE